MLSTAAFQQEAFPTVVVPDVQVQMMVFRGDRIYMDDFRGMLVAQIADCGSFLERELLLGLDVPSLNPSTFKDDWGNRSIGYSFLNDASNGLVDLRDSLLERVVSSEGLQGRFFVSVGPTDVVVNHSNAIEYLDACGEFLSKVSAAVLTACGNPPRGTELSGTQVFNTRYSMRNVVLDGGCVTFYHTRQKPQHISGHGQVSSEPPIAVDLPDRPR